MTGAPTTWQNPRIISILLLIFVCGATAGAVVMRMGAARNSHHSASYWKEGGKEISIERFKKELNLTPEQARDMEVVLNDFVMYYQTLQEQMNDVRASGKERILRILNEEQKQKFLRMMDLLSKQLK
ncbi:MAG: hypothetical protein HYZ37_03430 [Candidatus Solibacter usitatus]|nr:hypothetical protein [Candidatus Solibacter usitatus]